MKISKRVVWMMLILFTISLSAKSFETIMNLLENRSNGVIVATMEGVCRLV